MKHYWKPVFYLFIIWIIAFTLAGCLDKPEKKEDIIGTWETRNGEIMVVTEHDFIIQGIAFPYEYYQNFDGGKEKAFTVIAGNLGAMKGSYYIENDLLYLTIEGTQEIFCRR